MRDWFIGAWYDPSETEIHAIMPHVGEYIDGTAIPRGVNWHYDVLNDREERGVVIVE
jgi:hypothetical protein